MRTILGLLLHSIHSESLADLKGSEGQALLKLGFGLGLLDLALVGELALLGSHDHLGIGWVLCHHSHGGLELLFVGLWEELKGLSHDHLAHLVFGHELSLDDLTIGIPVVVLVALTTLSNGSITIRLTSLTSGRCDEVKELDKVARVKSIAISSSLLDFRKTSLFKFGLEIASIFLFLFRTFGKEVVVHEGCADNQSARGDS